jgi:hypothetical protein
MVRVSKWGVVSISIMSLSSILGTSNESGFSIGDKLFNVLGFPSWSHGYTGTHYTALFSIFLFLIGAIVAGKAFSGKRLAVVILLCITLVPAIALEARVLFLKTQSGLNTLEYKLKTSHLDIHPTKAGNVDVTGTIVLTNYGRDSISFGIRIPENALSQGLWSHKEIELTAMDGTKRSGVFRLSPGETKAINISTVQGQGEVYTITGTTNGPDLILFNQSEQRIVGYNR